MFFVISMRNYWFDSLKGSIHCISYATERATAFYLKCQLFY